MQFKDLSITFHTREITACKAFYEKYFGAKVTFDCPWYATIRLQAAYPMFLSFMELQCGCTDVSDGGVTLNLMVEDVDAEFEAMRKTDITILDEIADHEWGDRSFTVSDPLGNILYIYSMREMSEQYKDAVKE